MRYVLHPFAQRELEAAVDYYEERKDGLGTEFLEEVFSAIQRMLEFPNAWTSLSRRTRRCILNRFPYGIIYQVLPEEILIVAVTHLQRKPTDWRERL